MGREARWQGLFDLDGDLPVQLDGGLECFVHPIGASGIRMIYELYLQLQGRAESDGSRTRNLAWRITWYINRTHLR